MECMLTGCIATMWIILTGLFWSKVICVVPVKRKSFNQIWTLWIFLAQSGSCCPSERKAFSQVWTILELLAQKLFRLPQSKEKCMNQIELSWGDERSCFWVMCLLDINQGWKRQLCVIMVKDLKRFRVW